MRKQMLRELINLHNNLKDIKLIYQGSRDGYDSSRLANVAKNYAFTFCLIQSNYGKIFGAYTPV